MYKFIYLETYGCSANQNNSEIMKGILRRAGMDFTENPEIADILIINTCIIKGPTENKIKLRIEELAKLKKPLIVAGCMADVRKELVKKGIYLLGVSHSTEIIKLIRRVSENRYNSLDFLSPNKEIKLCKPKIPRNKTVGITQISEGCTGECNYCLARLAKGSLFSYPEEKIIENIKEDIKNGCREIWLTSQDTAAYGMDNKSSLIILLNKIISLKGKFRIRIGMMNPNHILPMIESLVEVYKNEKVYKFLHLPLQSGSDSILKSMNRKYSVQDFLKIVSRFRQEFPEMTLSTDIIVAYPGESEEDFQKTLKIIKEAQPDVMNFSKYWAMKGTKAAELPQIPEKVAKERVSEIQKLHLQISLERNKLSEGREIEVFVDEQEGTNCLARDASYRLAVIRSSEKLLGKTLKVKIKKAFPHYLLAELSKQP